MYLPLLGQGAAWAGWITTALVWLLLAAAIIALLAWTDKKTK
jgi:hypothetical protein